MNISCLSDLDIEAILRAAKTGMVITYEDHHVQTGLGSLIANVLAEHSLSIRFRKMGITQYGSSGKLDDSLPYAGVRCRQHGQGGIGIDELRNCELTIPKFLNP